MDEDTEAGGAKMLVSECGSTGTTRFLKPSKAGVVSLLGVEAVSTIKSMLIRTVESLVHPIL